MDLSRNITQRDILTYDKLNRHPAFDKVTDLYELSVLLFSNSTYTHSSHEASQNEQDTATIQVK